MQRSTPGNFMLIQHVKNVFGRLFPCQTMNRLVRVPRTGNTCRGAALVSYIKKSAMAGKDEVFPFHSNAWECFAIITFLSGIGFDVDVIDYTDDRLDHDTTYDLFFDIHSNLQRHAPFLPSSCLKILHITGSHPQYSIARELERVKSMEMRRGRYYSPKRIVDVGYFQKSLDVANACSLLGNNQTIKTFPEEYHHKIRMIPPTASYIRKEDFIFDASIKRKDSFIWFYKYGAVHKGLDLLLEIFSKRADLALHIFGNVHLEKDFAKIYEKELFNMNNIHLHGYVNPSSKKFSDISNRCVAFIGPSCSEGTSVAAATCMQAGLFPIISKDNGIDLPKNCGIIFENCSIDIITSSLDAFSKMSMQSIEEQVIFCKDYAWNTFSRAAFMSNIKDFFISLFNEHHAKNPFC